MADTITFIAHYLRSLIELITRITPTGWGLYCKFSIYSYFHRILETHQDIFLFLNSIQRMYLDTINVINDNRIRTFIQYISTHGIYYTCYDCGSVIIVINTLCYLFHWVSIRIMPVWSTIQIYWISISSLYI